MVTIKDSFPAQVKVMTIIKKKIQYQNLKFSFISYHTDFIQMYIMPGKLF